MKPRIEGRRLRPGFTGGALLIGVALIAAPSWAQNGSGAPVCKMVRVNGSDVRYCKGAGGAWAPASSLSSAPAAVPAPAYAPPAAAAPAPTAARVSDRAPPPRPAPEPPVPGGGQGAAFRPDFRGTVVYTGSYVGQTLIARPPPPNQRPYRGNRPPPPTPEDGGSFVFYLQITNDSLRGNYHSSGWLHSSNVFGRRTGGVCKFWDNNSKWTTHCGPDGFFGTAATDPGQIPSVTLTFNAPAVSYPTETDRVGGQRDTNAEAAALGHALLGMAAGAVAEERAAEKENHRRWNEAARAAVRSKRNIGACISSKTTYRQAPVRDAVGGYYNGTVRDDLDLVQNSCDFAVDVTLADGSVVTIEPHEGSRPSAPMTPRGARVHIY